MTRFYWMFTTGAGVAVLLATLLGLVVGIVVVTQTIYATTMDHMREFGTLKAMGTPNSYVYRVILQQAGMSAVIVYAMVVSLFVVHGAAAGRRGHFAALGHGRCGFRAHIADVQHCGSGLHTIKSRISILETLVQLDPGTQLPVGLRVDAYIDIRAHP
jgi:hypothetical protein